MKAIQYIQYTTDRSLADQVMNSSKQNPAHIGGRVIPQGAGFKILLFFKIDKVDDPDGLNLSYPEGARVVYLPKCLQSIYGVVF